MSNETAAKVSKITVQCQFCLQWNRVIAARAADRPKCGSCKRPILLDRPYTLTDDSLARTVAESDVPVFVDFYADWCGPCKVMAPSVDAIASRYEGRVLVTKLNTDMNQKSAKLHSIQGIPTSIVFSGGKAVSRESGALPLPQLEALLNKALE